MLRKVLFVFTTFLVVSTTALAGGGYMGLNVGSTSFVMNRKVTGGTTQELTGSSHTALAGGYIGYGWNSNKAYLGLEADAEWNWGEAVLKSGAIRVREQLRDGYGISLLPGCFLADNILMYVRLGGVATRFRSTSRNNDGANLASGGTINRYLIGGRAGLGLEALLGDHASLRLEYAHTVYEHFSKRHFSSSLSTTTKTRYRPSSNLFRLGITYNF